MSTVLQAYWFALDPNPEQESVLRSHFGAQQFAFNWGLWRIKANCDQRKAVSPREDPRRSARAKVGAERRTHDTFSHVS
ncbi:helix-turn-helix domain-containing protein [Saccharopolyspora pogona]|uniref:helix-turn-helix domain-containing protein n=1 Tax=Saccharopolyspora pogona TaxID=333966 RepID=UPI001CC25E77|nr:helix-turn-helix domain-containing protein [Saccharopolyspora pogona]